MASKNVVSMMVAMGAPYSLEELQRMNDQECWKWVRANQPPKKPRDKRPEVCFTGFRPNDREELTGIADRWGYKVVQSVTVKLKILVTGEAPGPVKLKDAKRQGVTIMDRDQFISAIKKKFRYKITKKL